MRRSIFSAPIIGVVYVIALILIMTDLESEEIKKTEPLNKKEFYKLNGKIIKCKKEIVDKDKRIKEKQELILSEPHNENKHKQSLRQLEEAKVEPVKKKTTRKRAVKKEAVEAEVVEVKEDAVVAEITEEIIEAEVVEDLDF